MESRFQPLETDEEREQALKEYSKSYLERIHEVRDAIFGTECQACGGEKDIHKKGGEPHEPRILWSFEALHKLNPEEWAALCRPCHLIVHAYMKRNLDWDTIIPYLKRAMRGLSQDDS